MNANGQHYIGINYGLILDQSPSSEGGNSCLLSYRGDLTKRVFLELGFGYDTHNAVTNYDAHDRGQTYTKSLKLHTEYYRMPLNINIIATKPSKRFRFIIMAGAEIGVLDNAFIKESYEETTLSFYGTTLSSSTQRIESSYTINVKNNSSVNRFDLAYQIGGACDIDRILNGAIRISVTTNKPILKTFKSESFNFIQNGSIYEGIRDGWLNIGFTYFIKIINESPFLMNPISKKKGNNKNEKKDIHF